MAAFHVFLGFEEDRQLAVVEYIELMVKRGRSEEINSAHARAIVEGTLDPLDAAKQDSSPSGSQEADDQEHDRP